MSTHVTIDVTVGIERLGPAEFARRFPGRGKRRKLTDRLRFITHPELPIGRGHTVCARCLNFHGTTWKADDLSRPIPPIHDRCYCEMVPELPAAALKTPERSEPALKPGEFLQRRLDRMNVTRLGQVIGKGRAKLAKAGLIDSGDLVSKAGGLVNLDDLLRRLGMTTADLTLTTRTLRKKFSPA